METFGSPLRKHLDLSLSIERQEHGLESSLVRSTETSVLVTFVTWERMFLVNAYCSLVSHVPFYFLKLVPFVTWERMFLVNTYCIIVSHFPFYFFLLLPFVTWERMFLVNTYCILVSHFPFYFFFNWYRLSPEKECILLTPTVFLYLISPSIFF